MLHKCELTLSVKDSDEVVSISGEFEERDWRVLEKFAQYAEELFATRLVQSGMASSLRMHWEGETGVMTVSTKLPASDDLSAFLHRFRPFGLEKESTYFYTVCNILSKTLSHPHIWRLIGDYRNIYSGKRTQSAYKIGIDNVILNSDKVLYDWLNSYEYHRVDEKREFIDNLHQVFPSDALKVLFIGLLADKAEAIFLLAGFVRVVLGKQTTFQNYLEDSAIE